jgi:hypothetical protein
LDTGSDDCVFPASLAIPLGLNYKEGRTLNFGGVGKGAQVAYFFDLELEVEGFPKYRVPVGFTEALVRVGILGQNGFFDHFSVEFDLPNDRITLKTK